MAGNQDVLREYLISLGFKTNSAATAKFGGELTALDKRATNLGKSLVGVTVAAATMTTEFAFRMEKLFYSSKLAETAAGNLQALDFGGKQIGIQNMTKNVESLARSLRANPGLQGLLNSLGVKVEGRDKSDVLTDLVEATKRMPFYIAEKYAAMFGISPDDLLLMQQGLDKMKEAAALRKQTAQDLGIDTEKAVKAGLEYAQQWREILMTVGLVRDAVSIELLPAMRELGKVTQGVLRDWARIVQMPREKFLKDLREGAGVDPVGGGVTLTDEAKKRADAMKGITPTKTWSEMSPNEREARGMSRNNPTWDELTPPERVKRGMPAEEKDKPLSWKMQDRWDRMWELGAEKIGIKRPGDGGGVELSSEAKERIGGDRTKSSSPTGFRKMLEDFGTWVGYKSKRKTPVDADAVEAATEPDRKMIEREEKFKQYPELSGRFEQAMRAGDYRAAQEIVQQLDGMKASGPQAQPEAKEGKPEANESTGEHQGKGEHQSFLRQMEQKYALPKGWLDKAWGIESGRGKHMLGPVTKSGEQAEGHFQFMPKTGKEYGLQEGDAYNFWKSAKAAGQYFSDLVRKYGGDFRYAAAAYNWGQGNLDKLLGKTMEKNPNWSQTQVDKYVLGALPKQTRDYVETMTGGQFGGGVTINADTQIHVHETTSPRDTAREVKEQQTQVQSDIVRQFAGRID